MSYNKKTEDTLTYRKSGYNNISNIDFKVEDIFFISPHQNKTIELIDINLRSNLKRNFVLKGTAINFYDFRCHKFLYKKVNDDDDKRMVYYISCFNKPLNKENLEELLFQNSDKKLISVIYDYVDDCSNMNVYYFIFLKIEEYAVYNYIIEEFIPDNNSVLFDLSKAIATKHCKLKSFVVGLDRMFIIKKKKSYC